MYFVRKITYLYIIFKETRAKEIERQLRSQEDTGIEEFFVSNEVGRGIRATKSFSPGDFIVEYHGPLLKNDEIRQRVKLYEAAGEHTIFMLHFEYNNDKYW